LGNSKIFGERKGTPIFKRTEEHRKQFKREGGGKAKTKLKNNGKEKKRFIILKIVDADLKTGNGADQEEKQNAVNKSESDKKFKENMPNRWV